MFGFLKRKPQTIINNYNQDIVMCQWHSDIVLANNKERKIYRIYERDGQTAMEVISHY